MSNKKTNPNNNPLFGNKPIEEIPPENLFAGKSMDEIKDMVFEYIEYMMKNKVGTDNIISNNSSKIGRECGSCKKRKEMLEKLSRHKKGKE